MNIQSKLLEEKIHSKSNATEISNYACASKKNFKQLMDCFLSKDYRLVQRAAWSVSWASRQKPEIILPYIKDLVAQLKRTDVHDAVIRNSLRVLEVIDIPPVYHGEVMNICFGFIENHTAPIAVKAFSLTILFNLSKIYPEIKAELKLIIEERWEHETAAFKSRGKKILKQIGKDIPDK